MKRCFCWPLLTSVVLNLLFLSGVTYVIHKRGGIEYLSARSRHSMSAVPHWSERLSLFQRLRPRRTPIVMLGDSLTEHCNWSEMFNDNAIVNRGISGDTSPGVLERLDEVIALNPTAVFLMIGVNDPDVVPQWIPEKTGRSVHRIVDRLRGAGITTYVQSVLPVGSIFDQVANNAAGTGTFRSNATIDRINTLLEAMDDGVGTHYINLHEQFHSGSSLNPGYTDGGIHLNGAGYQEWKVQIAPFIDQELRRRSQLVHPT